MAFSYRSTDVHSGQKLVHNMRWRMGALQNTGIGAGFRLYHLDMTCHFWAVTKLGVMYFEAHGTRKFYALRTRSKRPKSPNNPMLKPCSMPLALALCNNLRMYVYICMHIYIYIYVHKTNTCHNMYVYIHICIHLHSCLLLCMPV